MQQFKVGAALVVCSLFLVAGCGPGGDGTAVRTAVATGLVASQTNVSLEQAGTFPAHLDGNWAVAYDPAQPPGCVPGGLWDDAGSPAIPESPCRAWVLVRQKNRWAVLSTGIPGAFTPTSDTPKGLGDPNLLVYLAP
jgi:hypothetical protein